jgi:CheY-like chemotaxis protein
MGSRPAPFLLVVEDDVLLRTDVAETLSEAGYQVLQAGNADEAIQILEYRNDVRLVLTDVEMPGSMDGLKLAHCIAKKWPPVRLLVMSGAGMEPGLLPEGAQLCAKPCPPYAMTAAIADLLAEVGPHQSLN